MMPGYDAWKTTPPDGAFDEPEACPHCGSTGPSCSQDCTTQEEEPAEADELDCEVA